jgi:hypothetical protein
VLKRFFLIIPLAGLVLAGCAIDPYLKVDWDKVESSLQPGMTPEAVKSLLGEPYRVEEPDLDVAAGGIVTWVYRRKIPAGADLAATGVIEVPWFDPITGELKSEKQPSYTPVSYTRIEEFHLHGRQGVLYQWQRFVGHEQNYY